MGGSFKHWVTGAAVVSIAMLAPASASAVVFSNPAPITINDAPNPTTPAAATPYPSSIAVAGLHGTVTDVNVGLDDVNHTAPDDIDVLLVGPAGQKVLLMSDAGGGADLVNVPLTFDDAAATLLPDNTQISTGTYKPSNHPNTGMCTYNDTFPAPAPAPGPDPQLLSAFNGSAPNGSWSLYVVDDCVGGLGGTVGSIAAGWNIDIHTAPANFSSAGVARDTSPPQTTITKAPSNRDDDNSVKFKFKSSEAGSTFKCKIDGKPYKRCRSPKKLSVDEGKHKFKVIAVDAAGNADPTPDKDKFRVTE